MLEAKAWLTVSAVIPKGITLCWGQDSAQASQVLPHQSHSSISMFTLLCTCTNCLRMLKHWEFLSLELKGQAQLLKNNPPHNPPSIKLYTWHNAFREVLFSSQLSNPHLCVKLTDRWVWGSVWLTRLSRSPHGAWLRAAGLGSSLTHGPSDLDGWLNPFGNIVHAMQYSALYFVGISFYHGFPK